MNEQECKETIAKLQEVVQYYKAHIDEIKEILNSAYLPIFYEDELVAIEYAKKFEMIRDVIRVLEDIDHE